MNGGPMNAERLLQLYDNISEAPDAVDRLRRFVLNLAVRGKLVEQDTGDEPASSLAGELVLAKQRLVESRQIKKPKSSPPISSNDLPIDCPPHWEWLRLTDIGRLSGGMTPSKTKHEYWDGSIVWLSPKDIKSDELDTSELKITEEGLNETRLELYPEGCLFIVARSGILKRTFPVAINRVPAASNQDLKVLTPFVKGLERYLQIMFRGMTDFLLRELVKTGMTVQSLKYAEFEQQAFPLPPLAEQHRIVAKVDELMGLCDRLEETRKEREEMRDRLTTASLARLTAPDTTEQDFPTHASFVLNALPALTTRPDQIKSLRQTVLNLAVRGKLVEQDPADEPASELLVRIEQEKEKLFKNGKIKKPKKPKLIESSEVPFSLPQSWEWGRLSDLVTKLTDGTHHSPPNGPDGDFLYISAKNIKDFGVQVSNATYVSAGVHDEIFSRCDPEKGDILYIKDGATTGIATINNLDQPFSMLSSVALLKLPKCVFNALILSFLRSPFFWTQMREQMKGAAIMRVTLKRMSPALLPLPPLAEQHRIVAKVDELMALCDQLEAALTKTDTTRTRLLEALLHEALEPPSNNKEAAE